MALTATSLASAMTARDTYFLATAATGATVGGFAKVDEEYMFITAIVSTRIEVARRGSFGTSAKAHNALAPCTFGLVTDLPQPGARGSFVERPPRDIISVGATGAAVIPLPVRDTVVFICGAGATTATLADPGAAIDGVMITFVSTTAQAHTLTLTTGVYGSNASDVFTFAAVGQSVTLMAYKGLWAHLGASLNVDELLGSYPTLA